jgi:SnoaL-like domain
MHDRAILDDSANAALAALVDHHQVVDALYRFGAGQDLGDRALFESAFGPEAILDFTGPARRFGVAISPFRGRATIADTVMANTATLDTTHTVTNPRVSFEDGRATLFALVEAQHVAKGDPSRHLLLKNIYTVDLSRDGERWVIEHVLIENVWFTGDPTVLFPTTGRRS